MTVNASGSDNGEFSLDFDDLELNFDNNDTEDKDVVEVNETSENTEDKNEKGGYVPFSQRSGANKKIERPTINQTHNPSNPNSSVDSTVRLSKVSSGTNTPSVSIERSKAPTRAVNAVNAASNANTVDNDSDNVSIPAEAAQSHKKKPAVGTVSKATVKVAPKKGNRPLFDTSKINKKEEDVDFNKEYDFKSFIKGSDEVTKHLEERKIELRAKYGNTSMLKAAKIINAEIVIEAPLNYFEKYNDEVRTGIDFCRPKIRDSGNYEVIRNAIDNPTVQEYQEEAYVAAVRYINDFLASSKFRGIEKDIVLNLIINELLGFDVLDPLWEDPRITEIVCNGAFDIQVEIGGEMLRVPSLSFRSQQHLENLLERLFSGVGKSLAQTTPQAKGRLHDKSRIFATHHSISPEGPNFNIRRHPHGFWTPQALIDRGAASEEIMTDLGNLIHKGASFIIAGGTSTGKALTHDSIIHTPYGETTMGDIAIGDKVFDHNGNMCTVTNKFEQTPRQVYAVKLSTGNVVYADIEHNWLVSSLDNRNLNKKENTPFSWEVKTTGELLEEGLRKNGTHNFRIPVLAKPVEYDEFMMPETGNKIFEHQAYELGQKFTKDCKVPGKEINYGSVDIRKGFISGMIDTVKGKASENSTGWEFTHIEKAVVDTFVAIASSLGYVVNVEKTNTTVVTSSKGVLTEKEADTSTSYRAVISTKDVLTKDIHKVSRHVDNCRMYPLLALDTESVAIVDIEEIVGRVEVMSCITVDSPDSTYMVGDNFTVTHNTSMLNALTGFYPSNARILTLEDNLEMKPNPKKYLAAAQETRPPSPNKPNDRGVTMRDLVWGAMQMRPEVLIIGEVTDAAAYDLCQALNTGHAGASTFHANSSQLAVTRVSSLVAQSGLTTIEGAFDLIAAAFDFVINVRHFPQDGSRRVFSIDEVGSEPIMRNGKLMLPTFPIWKFNEEGIDKEGNIVGMWTKVGDISQDRAERRMFDYQRTLNWEELKELSSLPEGYEAV